MLSALCGSSPRRWRLITYKSAVSSSCLATHCFPGYRLGFG
ncbi:unnamed protein product [Staurois parvus]|uniref:Uncharacterized protein n=1 Tax=Staurois parvus TaxID=386267 RepID=A0ABN9H3G6_9NEOB|nr:unnamed protein product [Staurois parvus]